MMATASNSGRRYFADTRSPASLHAHGTTSTSPSLDPGSVKEKTPMGLALLSRKGAAQDDDGDSRDGIKEKNSNVAGPQIVVSRRTQEVSCTSRAEDVPVISIPKPQNQNSPTPPPKNSTRTRTVIKLISTKLRTRSPPGVHPPFTLPRSPPPTSGFASKANREAALRERGLLPPLKPNKDLSRAEKDQDQYIPILPPPTDVEILTVYGNLRTKVSAASLVKQEWEARNKITTSGSFQQERMNNFKFGGLSAPAAPQKDGLAPPFILTPVEEMDSPVPSPKIPQKDGPMSVVLLDGAEASPGHLSEVASLPDIRNNVSIHQNAVPEIPLSLSEVCLVPLPPSPLPSPRILPSTPSVNDVTTSISPLVIPADLPSLAIPNNPSSSALQPSLLISLSPPTPTTQPRASLPTDDPGPSNARPLSHPSLLDCEFSELTPSLDTSSHTMTVSTLHTSESMPNLGTRSRTNPLKLKVEEHTNNISIIRESSSEDLVIRNSVSEGTIPHRLSDASNFPSPHPDLYPRTRPRGNTNPTPALSSGVQPPAERRMTFNPFKRSHTAESPNPNLLGSSSSPPRRISMASLRSVVGSLARSKTMGVLHPTSGRGGGFDASHLPPPPTIPASFAEQRSRSPVVNEALSEFGESLTSAPAPRRSPRQAVSPRLHSRGSILVEASMIEDEESRRMTELAFLG